MGAGVRVCECASVRVRVHNSHRRLTPAAPLHPRVHNTGQDESAESPQPYRSFSSAMSEAVDDLAPVPRFNLVKRKPDMPTVDMIVDAPVELHYWPYKN